MSAPGVERRRYWLGEAFVVETRPAGGTVATGCVVLPPLGYEDTSAYRPLRVLADALAGNGHVVLRPDWPGLGDSGGAAGEADLVPRMLAAVADAAGALRAAGAKRVVGIGVRAGGLLGLAAGVFDEMVLWGTPASGAALWREERAFHRMAARAFGTPPAGRPSLPEGALEAGGFWYAAETVRGIGALVVSELGASLERALVIPREGVALHRELLPAAKQVEVAEVGGVGDLLEDPYRSALAPGVREAVTGWLAGAAPVPMGRIPGAAAFSPDPAVVEQVWLASGTAGQLSGVTCRPAGGAPGPWTLFFNAGGVRRSGPNRLWTRAARELAKDGVSSLRLDVRDVGDSDGTTTPHRDLEAMYSEASIQDALLAHDAVTQGDATAVDVVGLCSGAFLGAQVAARRPVRRATLFNCLAFVWDDDARATGMTSQVGRSLLDARRWRRLLSGRIDALALARAIASRARLQAGELASRARGRPPSSAVDLLLRAVRMNGTDLHLVSSAGDPSIAYLHRHVPEDRRPLLVILPGVDHTVRPVPGHDAVVQLIRGVAPVG
jgi:alpha/beta superfamily hydrolase